ncbi:Domain of unknown function DUF2520 [Pseudopedobacter saltans DSM 12145]|uniref:DUF2520 domain-containing protein n=1 Tax=Pseudopedobacter saltans (strain ATCC 51119 / DSM 12145 / JCM 21818 / CCUG 39354 / LMG 10337 / NBRC 100064 / NCIMB 13643) TaxID=762903 RepID=F0S9R7_PSESL|nr:Rossmann-like and DUF2520 domain-containing protein [Pseudopedobacter saltans]ADY51423.1 Domain of unknown function DUF2520 [Pseudopedobacter saltans DSM 12145]
MNVAILGAGNVAWHLSKAFIMAGHPVRQIWNRTVEKAADLSFEIGGNSIADLANLKEEIDLIVITVNDEAIEKVASSLNPKPHQIVVHTSGSTSIEVLRPYASNCGVIYPLQTFSKEVPVDFSKIPVFIEGSNMEITNKLVEIFKCITSKVEFANSAQRMNLHISAVFACNFTNHLYSIAADLLREHQLNFEYLKPLILETANKVMNADPADVQTGPARRNDQITMDKHLAMLSNDTDKQELYRTISQRIVKMYHDNQA